MFKKSLNISKFSYKKNEEFIFNSLSLSLHHSSMNVVLNEENLFNLLIKTLLNLTDSKIKATLYNFKIEDCFEEIGYYNKDIDLYKTMTIKELFNYSCAFYKNDYINNLKILISDFEIDIKRKIKDLNDEEYELIKIIDTLYHNPKLIILDNPFLKLTQKNQNLLLYHLRNMVKEGATILLFDQNISRTYSKETNYFIFNDLKLIKISDLKNKEINFKIDKEIEIMKPFIKNEDYIKTNSLILMIDYLKNKDVNLIDLKVGDNS